MSEVSLSDAISSTIDNRIASMNTAIPGKVLKVRDSFSGMTVDAQPCINMITEDEETFERPAVFNVPVQFPSSSTAGMTFPVNVGDSVLLVYSMRGMDNWKHGDGNTTDPTDYRMFSGRDCIAIPGIFTISNAINKKHSLAHDVNDTVMYAGVGTGSETEVRVKPSGQVIINAPSSVTVNTEYAEVNAPNSKFNGDVVVDGKLSVTDLLSYGNGISGQQGSNGNHINGGFAVVGGSITHNNVNIGSSHTHSGVQTGSGNTGGPQ